MTEKTDKTHMTDNMTDNMADNMTDNMTDKNHIGKTNLFKKFKGMQSWQVILTSMFLAVIVGIALGQHAVIFEPLGIIFMNLIKMISIPLIFFTLIFGMINIETSKDIQRIGLKAIVVFLFTAGFAVFIGIGAAHVIEPGVGLVLNENQMANTEFLSEVHNLSIIKMLLNLIPTNIVKALAEGNILQIILFALFSGWILHLRRDQCGTLVAFCQESAKFFFKMIESIMKIAPIGVFGYISYTVGTHGVSVILILGKLIFTIFAACMIQYIVFGLLIMLWGRMSPLPFYRKMVEPQLLAFSTSSSKATLTTLMRIAEDKLGISRQNSRFLIPLASALNMDGGAIYQGACAIFFAQVYGVEITISQYFMLLFMCTVASIGGAGIPGGVLLFLGMVLSSIGLPIEGVLLIASVDRILDMVTTTINVTGDACVTLLIDKSENTLNRETYELVGQSERLEDVVA